MKVISHDKKRVNETASLRWKSWLSCHNCCVFSAIPIICLQQIFKLTLSLQAWNKWNGDRYCCTCKGKYQWDISNAAIDKQMLVEKRPLSFIFCICTFLSRSSPTRSKTSTKQKPTKDPPPPPKKNPTYTTHGYFPLCAPLHFLLSSFLSKPHMAAIKQL